MFIVSIVAHAPILFAMKFVPNVDGLEIEAPTGTIWNGQAQSVVWRGHRLGQVSWQFQPIKLIEAKVDFAIRFGRNSEYSLMGKGDVGYGLSGPYAQNVVASLPASVALQQLSVPIPLSATGTIELSVNEYLYSQPWCKTAVGTLVWNGSKVASPIGELDLGTIITDIQCEDNRVSLEGSHSNSQLDGAVSAVLQPTMRYDVTAWFKPGTDFPLPMQSQLKWLGNPNSKGEFPFVYSGKLN
jgi:general secretion pathway protein N